MKYVYIENIVQLINSDVINEIRKAKEIALDTETTGLDVFRCKLCLIQIAIPEVGIYILNVFKMGNSVIQKVRDALNESEAVLVIHNSKFDLKVLHLAGIEIKNDIYDTMLAEQTLNHSNDFNGYKLADIVERYLGITLDKTEQSSDWTLTLTKNQINYAGKDVEYLCSIKSMQLSEAENVGLVDTIQLENQVVKATYKMELTGIMFHKELAKKYMKQMSYELKEVQKNIQNAIPSVLNPNSTRQLLQGLEWMGVPIISTEKSELKKYASECPVIEDILKYRKIVKNISTFEKLLQSINRKTNRIHASFNQNTTVTGRYSCSKPNLQGIPHDKRFRQCFVASEGCSLVICDYSQMELRIVADMADEAMMIQIFNEEKDIHRLTASLVNGCPYEVVTDEDRSGAKALNFGLIYGIGINSFIDYAQDNYGVTLTYGEAKYRVQQFFINYKGIGKRINILLEKPDNEERTLSGRRRKWDRMPPITERANFGVQGTGADILKIALVEIDRTLLTNPNIKLVSTIHDEVILEVKTDIAQELKCIMEEAGNRFIKKVPIIAEVSIGHDWSAK